MKFFFENKDRSVTVWEGRSLEYGAHLHTHLEMVYMLEGTARVIVDARAHSFGPGDFLLIFPNQIHEYRRIGAEKYLIAIIPPDLCPEYQHILKNKVPRDPILSGADDGGGNRVILDSLRGVHRLAGLRTPFTQQRVKGYFLIALGEAFSRMEWEDAGVSDSDTVKAVLGYCLENYSRPLSLETLSAALHLNKYYLSHLFTDKLHVKFVDYIAVLRISSACEALLGGDDSITDIAYQSGFNSPRSFNRLFQKHMGVTPRAYRSAGGMEGAAIQDPLLWAHHHAAVRETP